MPQGIFKSAKPGKAYVPHDLCIYHNALHCKINFYYSGDNRNNENVLHDYDNWSKQRM